jgi:hypothetical protein
MYFSDFAVVGLSVGFFNGGGVDVCIYLRRGDCYTYYAHSLSLTLALALAYLYFISTSTSPYTSLSIAQPILS